MRKKIIIGLLLSLLPIYSFFSWIYVFSKNPETDQSFKLRELDKMFFGISINQTTFAIINILLSFAAMSYLMKFQNIKNGIIKIISVVIILLLILITLYNFWGLL